MYQPVLQFFIFAAFGVIALSNAHACLDNKSIEQLKLNEEALLISRDVATMNDAIEDKLLSIQVKQFNDTCDVTITYTIPEEDVVEANRLLDNNPAKRIMLAGQGYVLPTETILIANADVNLNPLSIKQQDILQSADLGRNRASVELLYATLAQIRAVIKPDSINNEPWPINLINQEISLCESQLISDTDPNACTCKTNLMSKKVSPRQLRSIKYLANDPYSSATGALTTYQNLSEEVNFECKLRKR